MDPRPGECHHTGQRNNQKPAQLSAHRGVQSLAQGPAETELRRASLVRAVVAKWIMKETTYVYFFKILFRLHNSPEVSIIVILIL